jgi:hypothetical protein
LSKTRARASAILVDELNAGPFERSPDYVESRATRLTRTGFQLMHGYDSDSRFARKILLTPRKQPASGPTLCWGNHSAEICRRRMIFTIP